MTRIGELTSRWLRDTAEAWNRFWFTPADAATLGLIRIFAAAMLLYTHAVWSLRLEAFFGPQGWLPLSVAGTLRPESYALSWCSWISAPWLTWTVHIAALVVFALLMVGYRTRLVSVLAWLAALSYVHRAPAALFGLDQINILLAAYLMVGASGDAWSVDRWLAARRAGGALPPAEPKVSTNIATRLIQLHMCVIYLFAGMGKLQGPAWWDGTAMWLALGNYEYQSLDMTWMAWWPRLINVLTQVTLFWEIFYCALIWPRALRPIMLVLAVPLHLGIAVCLGMVTFGLVMLVANLAFVSPVVIRALATSLSGRKVANPARRSGTPVPDKHR